MKITIEPEEGEKCKKQIIKNVIQFTIGGSHIRDKLHKDYFRQSFISDKSELIGIIKMLEEDVRNHGIDSPN